MRILYVLKDLILFMLEADQFTRGSATDMLEHPWLAVSCNPMRNNTRLLMLLLDENYVLFKFSKECEKCYTIR